MNTQLKEDDIVLCIVKRVERTTVFLQIEGDGEGSMTFSEVSPGRIRNIREFIVPNKKIVCKILRIKDGHPELSLRRVTAKEREEIMDRYKKENTLASILKSVLKEKTPEVLEKIKEKYELTDFLDEARENPKIIKDFVTPKQYSDLTKIFIEKKEKEKEVKETIIVKSISDSGILDIKQALDIKHVEIYYLGSGKFSISVKAKDYKTANTMMEKVNEELKEKAKSLNVKIETKSK